MAKKKAKKKRPEGRMIRKDISNSDKIASLSPKSLALFGMLIPHFNAHGKMNGNLYFIKGEVVPKIKWFTLAVIKACLTEISEKTNVKWFQKDGMWYLHSLNFEDHQDLREDRRGDDRLPDYSRSIPGLVRPEVEVEVEVEVESKEEESLKLKYGKNGKGNDASLPSKEKNQSPEVVDAIVKHLNDEKSRFFYDLRCKALGEGRMWELFGDMKDRQRAGKLQNPAAYLNAIIEDEVLKVANVAVKS